MYTETNAETGTVTYAFERTVSNGLKLPQAWVHKFLDGKAAWETASGGYHEVENADIAFGIVRRWLEKMDSCHGFTD